MTVKLINKGQRDIHYGLTKTQIFSPGKAVVFSDETAAYLKKLYKNELVDINDIEASYEDGGIAEESKPVEVAESDEAIDAPRRGRPRKDAE